jgi:hypothetical protein
LPLRLQTFDSNGPDVRIRGNAYQVHEKYLQLARDASSSGDRVAAENYFQHAEHYFRIISADLANTQAQQQQAQASMPGAPQPGFMPAPGLGGNGHRNPLDPLGGTEMDEMDESAQPLIPPREQPT